MSSYIMAANWALGTKSAIYDCTVNIAVWCICRSRQSGNAAATTPRPTTILLRVDTRHVPARRSALCRLTAARRSRSPALCRHAAWPQRRVSTLCRRRVGTVPNGAVCRDVRTRLLCWLTAEMSFFLVVAVRARERGVSRTEIGANLAENRVSGRSRSGERRL